VLLTLIEPRILFIESVGASPQRTFFFFRFACRFTVASTWMPVKIPLIRPSYASRASLEADYPAGGLMNARARPWVLVDTNNVRTWSWPHQEDEELVSRHMKIISIHQRAEREVNSSS
jgi:hypothetical protein